MLQVDPWGMARGLHHPWPLLQPFLLCPEWVSGPDDEGLSLSLSQARPYKKSDHATHLLKTLQWPPISIKKVKVLSITYMTSILCDLMFFSSPATLLFVKCEDPQAFALAVLFTETFLLQASA